MFCSFVLSSVLLCGITALPDGIPQLSHLRLYTSFDNEVAPLQDESGYFNDLVIDVGSPTTLPHAGLGTGRYLRIEADERVVVRTTVGTGQSANGTTVCTRFRVWSGYTSPSEGSGFVLRMLQPGRSNVGSIFHSDRGTSTMRATIVADTGGCSYTEWDLALASGASDPFTHVCVSWFYTGSPAYAAYIANVDGSPLTVSTPCVALYTDTVFDSSTVIYLGVDGVMRQSRGSRIDIDTLAVWNTALTQEQVQTYIVPLGGA